MREGHFQALMKQLSELTPSQRQRLEEQLTMSVDAERVHKLIEQSMGEEICCPHCEADRPRRWGCVDGLQRYRCRACLKTFNALTGTPLARLRNREKWLSYSKELARGSSVRQAAKAVGVNRNTSFHWRHRFLALPQNQSPAQLTGIAEADETFFLQSFKGVKRGLKRKARKRGGKAKKRGTSAEQVPVLIARDRAGATFDVVLASPNTEEITRALHGRLSPDTVLCADGAAAYRHFAASEGIMLKAVNLSAGIRVREGVFHIQNVNAYDSRLKGWMHRFHGVATAYLPSYLGWRRMIERHANAPSGRTVLAAALGMPQHVNGT